MSKKEFERESQKNRSQNKNKITSDATIYYLEDKKKDIQTAENIKLFREILKLVKHFY